MNWRELKDNNITAIGGAVSGGLDSCTATHWLRSKGFEVTEEYARDGVQLVTLTKDLGASDVSG